LTKITGFKFCNVGVLGEIGQAASRRVQKFLGVQVKQACLIDSVNKLVAPLFTYFLIAVLLYEWNYMNTSERLFGPSVYPGREP
jgi:hypothetical protein